MLWLLGPIGAAMIAYAVATTPVGEGDGVMLYVWPLLWVAYFFGGRETIAIVAWIGAVQAAALIHSDGVLDRWIDLMVSIGLVAAVVHELSERNRRLVTRLRGEARVDKLTGVLNRRGFEERAAIEVERARREGHPVAAATFDIDFFKRVNDEWGHETGDHVLEALGEVLRSETRAVDIVARYGGEEFVTLLPDCGLDEAERYAERVRARFGEGERPGIPHASVSAGVTAALMPESVEALLAAADSALYAAKRGGRNRTVAHRQSGVPVPS